MLVVDRIVVHSSAEHADVGMISDYETAHTVTHVNLSVDGVANPDAIA